METTKTIWDRSKTDKELTEKFRKLVQLNLLHNNIPLPDILQKHLSNGPQAIPAPEFYNFISVIIKPDQERSLREVLYELYQSLDFGFLLNFFFKDQPIEAQGFNLESMARLRKIFEEVKLPARLDDFPQKTNWRN